MVSIQNKFKRECPFEMKWIINEEKLRMNNFLRSNKFKAAFIPGVEYYVQIYPNGRNNKSGVWIFFHLKSVNRKINAKFKITIISALYESKYEKLYEKDNGHGHRLCSTENLFNPEKGFMVDGKLTIKIKGILQAQGLKLNELINVPRGLGDLLLNHKEKDFIIVVEEKEIPVHKWILEARSTVFKAMFESGMKEAKENRHVIPDFSFEVVKATMDFLYEQNVSDQITEDYASEFLHFADKYNFEQFHDLIQTMLIEKLNKSNVCELANASVTSNAHKLREYCTCLIALCLKESKAIDNAETLCDDILKDVSQRMLLSNSQKAR